MDEQEISYDDFMQGRIPNLGVLPFWVLYLFTIYDKIFVI